MTSLYRIQKRIQVFLEATHDFKKTFRSSGYYNIHHVSVRMTWLNIVFVLQVSFLQVTTVIAHNWENIQIEYRQRFSEYRCKPQEVFRLAFLFKFIYFTFFTYAMRISQSYGRNGKYGFCFHHGSFLFQVIARYFAKHDKFNNLRG